MRNADSSQSRIMDYGEIDNGEHAETVALGRAWKRQAGRETGSLLIPIIIL
jgi:hypothetical protein